MRGPEQVFRVRVARPIANFGVAVLSGGVQPRVVANGDGWANFRCPAGKVSVWTLA